MDIIIRPWYKLVAEEILSMYYAIQLFSITIWFMNDYYRSGAIVSKSYHITPRLHGNLICDIRTL